MSADTVPEALAQNGAVEEPQSLAQKLLAVAADVANVEKDGHNDFADYDYATAENILRSVRAPLAGHGVLLLTALTDVAERPIKTAKGKDSAITTVRVAFRFVDVASGEKVEIDWAGTGDDPSDKGLYKAYTGAIKTFLRSQFLLPLGDDPEADKRADERTEGGPAEPSAERRLPAEKVDPLRAAIEKAGLLEHLPMKLRGFGVSRIDELTVEQGIALYEWAQGGQDG